MSKNDIEFETLDIHAKPADASARNKRMVLLGGILIVILLIIAVCSVSARKKQDALRASEVAASLEAESLAAAEAARHQAELPVMELCEDPEIKILVQEYFDARMNADSSRIFQIFGRSDTAADDEFEKKLRAQASWIQGFQNLTVYAANGLQEGEKLCLVCYNIDFRRTDTLAPGIMYFYAVPDGNGSYTFTEVMAKERVDFTEEILGTEKALSLIRETDDKLKEGLDRDSTLALIYESFRSGEIYKESNLDIDREQDVDLFMNPEDSILVGDDVLQNIRDEAEHAAQVEASEGENDVYETDAAEE